MKRLERAVVLADLAEKMRAQGSWCGETHMQKAVYFLQELLRVPMGYGYILYKHGPFSFDLRDDISDFRVYDLFRLEPRPVPYGPTLRPTLHVGELKNRFSGFLKSFSSRLDYVAQALDGKGVAELERLATALFVSVDSEEESPEIRAGRICELKPHVPVEHALAATRELDIIRERARNLFTETAS
jgi:hypothetical protein